MTTCQEFVRRAMRISCLIFALQDVNVSLVLRALFRIHVSSASQENFLHFLAVLRVRIALRERCRRNMAKVVANAATLESSQAPKAQALAIFAMNHYVRNTQVLHRRKTAIAQQAPSNKFRVFAKHARKE
jgi:hypothetical protein